MDLPKTAKGIMDKLARLLSFLFHPVIFFLLMPFLVVYRETQSGFYALKWQIFSSLFIFLGIMLALLGRWRGVFSDHELSVKEERSRFYAIVWLLAFSYLVVALYFKGIIFPLSLIALGILLGIVIFEIANRFIKVSMHIAVASAFVLAVGLLFGKVAFTAAVWMVPVAAWARIKLRKHTLGEVIAGGMLGVGVVGLTVLIRRYLINF